MKKIIKNIIIPVAFVVCFGKVAFGSQMLDTNQQTSTVSSNIKFENKESIYINFSGTVKKVVDMKYFKRIMVSSSEGEMIAYNVYYHTPIYDQQCKLVSSLSEGDNVVVGYKRTTPQTETSPPQINPEVIVVFDKEKFKVSIDFYNEKGISSDGSLFLDTSKTSQIVDLNNITVGNPLNKNIVTVYNLGTFSYPSKIAPKNIIVLEGKTETSTYKDKLLEAYLKSLTGDEIYVKDDVRYIMLSTITEKYDYKLEWNIETKDILVSKGNSLYTLKQGVNYYMFNEATSYFKNPPIEYNEKTYVEIEFLGRLFK